MLTRTLLRAALRFRRGQDLLRDLYSIPARAADRKVNEFVKRCARGACIIAPAASLRLTSHV
jgi:hypothetical protein